VLEATKYDEGKEDWSQLPIIAIRPVVRVLQFGAKKYGPFGYMNGKGMKWSRVYSAAQRHLTAWQEGEDRDPESGELHLCHTIACCLMLICYQLVRKYKVNDDRPKLFLKKEK
jgi:hypothetical protein